MPFLSINGWTVLAKEGGASEQNKAHAELSPYFRGRPARSRVGVGRSWSIRTPKLTGACADTLEGLLEGRGHHWSFDHDFFSDDGFGPASTTGLTIEHASPKFGYGYLKVASGNSATFQTELPNDTGFASGKFTIIYWRDISGTPEQITVRSDGTAFPDKWIDGARNDFTSTPELSIVDGEVIITASGTDVEIDDLVVLPFAACEEAILAFYASGVAFSALPRLSASGDMVGNDTIIVEGITSTQTYLQHGGSGGWVNNSREVQFTLDEVKPQDQLERAPAFLASQLLDEKYISGTDIRWTKGGFSDGTVSGAPTTGATGPYGHGESIDFSGTNQWLEYDEEAIEALKHARAVTVLALAKRDASGVAHTILSFIHPDLSQKLLLQFDSSDQLSVAAKPQSTDAVFTDTSTATITSTDWEQVGVIVDLPNDVFRYIHNGRIIESSAAQSFTSSEFDDAARSDSQRIGGKSDGSEEFDGKIGMVGIAPRALTEAEMRRHLDLARRGVFA